MVALTCMVWARDKDSRVIGICMAVEAIGAGNIVQGNYA